MPSNNNSHQVGATAEPTREIARPAKAAASSTPSGQRARARPLTKLPTRYPAADGPISAPSASSGTSKSARMEGQVMPSRLLRTPRLTKPRYARPSANPAARAWPVLRDRCATGHLPEGEGNVPERCSERMNLNSLLVELVV